jgi:hypothetical protein
MNWGWSWLILTLKCLFCAILTIGFVAFMWWFSWKTILHKYPLFRDIHREIWGLNVSTIAPRVSNHTKSQNPKNHIS